MNFFKINVSKNQVVWARCHLVGLTSGIDCTTQSSGSSSAHKPVVKFLTARKRASKRSARDARAAEYDPAGVASPIADEATELKRSRLPVRVPRGGLRAFDRAP